MKIVIFGATGGAGRRLVEQALAAGHDVTAVARDPAAVKTTHERLRVVAGDVSRADAVAAAIAGQDAVVAAIGPRKGTPPGTLISGAAQRILDGMRAHGVQRLVLTSGLMVGRARGMGFLGRVGVALFRRLNRALYRDKVVAERLVRESDRDWVIVRPPQFDDRPPRGTYRMGEDLDVKLTTMSESDVAAALLHALTDDKSRRKELELSY